MPEVQPIFVVKAASSLSDPNAGNIQYKVHDGYSMTSTNFTNFTLDGLLLGTDIVVGDWIILKDQIDKKQNGLWYVQQTAYCPQKEPTVPNDQQWILVRQSPGGNLFQDQIFYLREGE